MNEAKNNGLWELWEIPKGFSKASCGRGTLPQGQGWSASIGRDGMRALSNEGMGKRGKFQTAEDMKEGQREGSGFAEAAGAMADGLSPTFSLGDPKSVFSGRVEGPSAVFSRM
jgi:hypothetical protein